MAKELKVRIANYEETRKKLEAMGGKFTKELHVTDTYFKQPEGHVLKITEDEDGDFIVELQAKEGGFDYIRYDKINDVDELKAQLTKKWGIRRILKKRRVFFDYKNYKLNFNLIENVGDFLILEAERPSKDFFSKELKMKNPEFIMVSFDQLPVKA